MKDYRLSLWTSNFIIIIISALLIVAVKYIFNPLLWDEQQKIAFKYQLANLPTITTLSELDKLSQAQEFSYIKIDNEQLTSPLIISKPSKHELLEKIIPIQHTIVHADNASQVIEYKAVNDALFQLYRSLILIIVLALFLSMISCNLIYFRLFKKIESSLVDEIANDEHKETPFARVSAELLEQKRLFHKALQEQEHKIVLLARQVNMDNLTGLNNRHAFRKELTEYLSSEDNQQPAILAIIRLFELSSINERRGFQQGDEYIINVASMITQVTEKYKDIHVSRIGGSDFALIAHGMTSSAAEHLSQELKSKFDEYQTYNHLDSVAFNGLTSICPGQPPEQVLARADIALAKAQTEGVNAWAFQENDTEESLFGQQHWKTVIEEIIEKRSLMLLHQPIQAIHRNMKGYEEIFTRFIGNNKNIIPTDTVFAMAQRTELVVKLEQIIIEKMVSQCRHRSDHTTRWGLNISASAVQNSSFIVWLERLLLREPDIAGTLIFEVQEHLLESNLNSSKRLFEMLKRVGSRSAICNFGRGIGSFRLFKELSPDFVKVDATLISNIQRDSANQQFVRMIIDVAHRMDCKVIAEGIEHVEQKQILEAMYVDGVQGYLVARPAPL